MIGTIAFGLFGLAILIGIALVGSFGMLGVAMATLVTAVAVRIVAQPALGCRAVGISYAKYLRQLAEIAEQTD